MADGKLVGALNEVYAKEHENFKKRLRIAVIVILVAVVGIWLGIGLWLHSRTQRRMETMTGRAQTFAMLTQQWQNRGKELESGTYQVKEQSIPFEENLMYYFADRKGDWFGVVLDENGEIQYTMYSRSNIPEDYLQTPPDYDKQYKLLGSLFGFQRKKAVAVWEPAETTNE